MSAQNRTQNKSVEPEGLENKSLTPDLETKVAAVEPKRAEDGRVEFQLSQHVSAGRIDDKDHVPGDKVRVTPDHAYVLQVAGAGQVVS